MKNYLKYFIVLYFRFSWHNRNIFLTEKKSSTKNFNFISINEK